jgi:hypothetical protein
MLGAAVIIVFEFWLGFEGVKVCLHLCEVDGANHLNEQRLTRLLR